jgi:hypothetical protein
MATKKKTTRVATPRILPFAEFVEVADKGTKTEGAEDSARSNGDDFGGCSFDEAIRLARFGWHEGVQSIKAALSTDGTADTVQAWEIEQAGIMPCIPAFLSGSPVCMYQPVETDGSLRRIALCFSMSGACTIRASSWLRFAAALSQVTADLTAAGIDVAVYSFEVSRARGTEARHSYGVAIREFGEPFDLSRIAFAGHPAFLRRLGFSYCENTPAHLDIARSGYGMPESVTVADVRACGSDLPIEAIRCLPKIDDNSTSTAEYVEQFRKIVGEVIAA